MATLFITFPCLKLFKLFTAISISRTLASLVAHAICGVMKQFFALSKGLSAFGGSVERTSTPAAAIFPSFRASAKSCSLINGPRPVLIIMAVGYISARRSLLTISFVDGVSGQCKLIISQVLNNSSNSNL